MKLKNNLSSPLAWCLSSILIGFLLVVFNEELLRWLFYILGIALFVIGLVPIVTAFSKKQEMPILSFLYLIGGILIVVMNNRLSAILFVLLGVLLMLSGIQNIVSFINIHRVAAIPISFASYIVPILCILGGAVAIANPFVAQKTLIIYIGLFILVEGIYNLFSLTALYHNHKTQMKQFFSSRKETAEDAVVMEETQSND